MDYLWTFGEINCVPQYTKHGYILPEARFFTLLEFFVSTLEQFGILSPTHMWFDVLQCITSGPCSVYPSEQLNQAVSAVWLTVPCKGASSITQDDISARIRKTSLCEQSAQFGFTYQFGRTYKNVSQFSNVRQSVQRSLTKFRV